MRLVSHFRFLLVLWLLMAGVCASAAQRDQKAVDVLQTMSAYLATLNEYKVEGAAYTDARFDGGLMVANPSEVLLLVDRPNSLFLQQFDGVDRHEFYLSGATFTQYNSATNYYAVATVPPDLGPAMKYAVDELGIDAPLIDLVVDDVFTQMIQDDEEILYLNDRSRVSGVDCHHLVIRLSDTDVQLWVQMGKQPVPRRMEITSKWEGGAPSFIAELDWTLEPKITSGTFIFAPPEDAIPIKFDIEE
jgi:hypothetical protein